MTSQRRCIADALRDLPLGTLLDVATEQSAIAHAVAARLVERADLVSTLVADEDGCGFWLPARSLEPGLLYSTRAEAVRDWIARLRAADAQGAA